LLDMEEVSRWLATSPRHVQRLVTERRIPFLKIGHFIRFDEKDVACWIEDQKSPDSSTRTKRRPALAQPVGSVGAQSLAPRATGRQAPSSSQPPAWMRGRAT
jgi:excisionase family DNA binding protein